MTRKKIIRISFFDILIGIPEGGVELIIGGKILRKIREIFLPKKAAIKSSTA